jgi:RimK family alpha-L-glutamate ligase
MKAEKSTCWIVVNGYLQHSKFSELALFVKESAERNNINPTIVLNHELICVIENGKASLAGRFSIERPDFILFMDKDIHLAKHLENMGIPVYNNSESIDICDSKGKTHQALMNHGIPMPRTFFAPFTYEGIQRKDFQVFFEIGDYLGYPLVLKESYGSFGEQVYLVQSQEQLLELVKQIDHKPFILQEFIEVSKGRDIRLNVVGDKVVAGMLRTSETDFRANVTAGGTTAPYTPTAEEESLAIRCAQILNVDFAGIDLLFGEKGPLLCEVNSNSHLLNIYACTGINIADHMIDYILEKEGLKDGN